MRRALALEDIKAAKTQALAQAQDTEQQLRSHLEALSRYDRRVRDVLEHLDDRTFLQVPGPRTAGRGMASRHLTQKLTVAVPGAQESQLLAPPGPLRPLTPLRWDGEQRLASLKESLSRLCGLLLDEGGPCRAPVEAANLGPVGKAHPDPSLPLWAQPALPRPTGTGSGLCPHELCSPSLP